MNQRLETPALEDDRGSLDGLQEERGTDGTVLETALWLHWGKMGWRE